jgi:hypothetical protein
MIYQTMQVYTLYLIRQKIFIKVNDPLRILINKDSNKKNVVTCVAALAKCI